MEKQPEKQAKRSATSNQLPRRGSKLRDATFTGWRLRSLRYTTFLFILFPQLSQAVPVSWPAGPGQSMARLVNKWRRWLVRMIWRWVGTMGLCQTCLQWTTLVSHSQSAGQRANCWAPKTLGEDLWIDSTCVFALYSYLASGLSQTLTKINKNLIKVKTDL